MKCKLVKEFNEFNGFGTSYTKILRIFEFYHIIFYYNSFLKNYRGEEQNAIQNINLIKQIIRNTKI